MLKKSRAPFPGHHRQIIVDGQSVRGPEQIRFRIVDKDIIVQSAVRIGGVNLSPGRTNASIRIQDVRILVPTWQYDPPIAKHIIRAAREVSAGHRRIRKA